MWIIRLNKNWEQEQYVDYPLNSYCREVLVKSRNSQVY